MHILTVAHNHSAFHPGGTETVAEALSEEYGNRKGLTSAHLAGVDSAYRRPHSGAFLQGLSGAPNVTLFRSIGFDVFNQNQSRFDGLLFDLSWYLEEQRPDVVHLHHLIHFGIELPVLIKKLLPDCRIVMTLHDYYLICPNDGLMVKTGGGGLCHAASPDACRGCFADKPEMVFQVRKQNILNHLEHVDMFVAPSEFLRTRFIDWGIPKSKIKCIPNGRSWARIEPDQSSGEAKDKPRNRFGIFGNLRETKGTLVAAEAAARLVEDGFRDFSLEIFGEAFFQPDGFKNQLNDLVARADGHIRLNGRFDIDQLPALMKLVDWVVTPSTWWENAPLAIQDAFAHGKPVIVSNIGGMGEAVRNGVDGLHARVADIPHWMEQIRTAASSPDLWAKLASRTRPPASVAETADQYLSLFENLKSKRSSQLARAKRNR